MMDYDYWNYISTHTEWHFLKYKQKAINLRIKSKNKKQDVWLGVSSIEKELGTIVEKIIKLRYMCLAFLDFLITSNN
jgi:hypothetical protein